MNVNLYYNSLRENKVNVFITHAYFISEMDHYNNAYMIKLIIALMCYVANCQWCIVHIQKLERDDEYIIYFQQAKSSAARKGGCQVTNE